jgi:NADPH-dependent curcumin reductase CurA
MTKRNVWRLARRPTLAINEDDLQFGNETLRDLVQGEVLLRVRYLSIDPAQRVFMGEQEQFIAPIAIGSPVIGVVVGVVVETLNDALPTGTMLTGLGEWADYIITDGKGFTALPDVAGRNLSEVFGTLSLVGPTAYFGLLDIGRPSPGETLVVSAAAGGVGQVVGQIGKMRGCRVIGIAGGSKKCAFVTEDLGFDACIDYKSMDVGSELDRLAPQGVDIYFEQVGGPIRDAVMTRMKMFGRVAVCGMIADYGDTTADIRPGFWWTIMMRRLTVQGFIVNDYVEQMPAAIDELARWMRDGHLITRQDVRHGLDKARTSLQDVIAGRNLGKVVIEIAP